MISSLRGRVLAVDAETIVIDVNGVGYAVSVPMQLARAFHPGDDIVVHTHLAVREDAVALYGFDSREELVLFGQLLGVSGVGPKSALGVLSAMSVDQVAQAVAEENDAPFRKVSGIGPKTAKLIVVQLTGRLLPPASAPSAARASGEESDVETSVVTALIGLGWSERVAADVVAGVVESSAAADRTSVSALLRIALGTLGPARPEPSRG